MEKKGSHVGMMLSFIIFITFFVFLYTVLQPIIKTEQNKKLILDSLEIELVEMLATTHILELEDEYNLDYEELKTKLNVPVGSEFGFSFMVDGGTMEITVGEEKIPKNVNVYAKKIPLYYIDEEENILLGILNLKVW